MNKKEYKIYLKSDWWVYFSSKIKKERKKCQKCGTDKKLNVHHLTYVNRGSEKDEDVLVLCRFCHKDIHGIKIEKKVKFNKFKKKKLRLSNLCIKCGKNKISIKEYSPLCQFCYFRKQKNKANRKFRKLQKRLSMSKNAKCFNLKRNQTIFDLPLDEKIRRIKERGLLN